MGLVALALIGCTAGPSVESKITDLRVLGARVEPAEPSPGDLATIDVVVADPAGGEVELAIWTCTDFGAGCLEIGAEAPVTVWRGATTDGLARATALVPPALAGLLQNPELPEIPVGLWVLACPAGACPVLDAIDAAPAPGTDEHADLVALLGDPPAILADLPFGESALSSQEVTVSARPVEERNHNPDPLTFVAPETAPVGEAVFVELGASDPDGDVVEVLSLSDVGGFPAGFRAGAAVDFTRPEDAPDGGVRVWLVARDGRGGFAFAADTVFTTP